MNIYGPKLFQVFAIIDGQKKRFHMQGNGADSLEFTLRSECPQFLLDIEEQIREELAKKYSA